jgi:putative transposase
MLTKSSPISTQSNLFHSELDMDDYIEFYNHKRFHETLKYKKPMDVYQKSIKLNQEKKKAS